MRRHLIFAFVTLVLAAGCLHAQSVSLKANVPFDFIVGDTMLPAGTYTVKPIGVQRETVLLRSDEVENAIFVVPCSSAVDRKDHDSELVFQVSRGRHSLWQIWTHNYEDGRQLSVRLNESPQEGAAGSDVTVTRVTAITIQP